MIQDNDRNLMMLAAGWWQATALSWGQCYEIFCVWAKTGEQDHCWLLCHNPTAGGCSRAGHIWIYHRCPLHVKTGFIAWHCEIPRAIIMELISELQLWLVVSLTSLNLCPFSLSGVWNNPLQRYIWAKCCMLANQADRMSLFLLTSSSCTGHSSCIGSMKF